MLNVRVCTCPQSPSLALSSAARGVRSASRPCRGSPPIATRTQPRHLETRYGRMRVLFGPTDKEGRSFLAAARAAGKIRCCEPCARGRPESPKRARARANGESSDRARQIRLHFSHSGDLSEGRDALKLAGAHFYAAPEGGARGAQMTQGPVHQKIWRTRRSAAQSTFKHAQQLSEGPAL